MKIGVKMFPGSIVALLLGVFLAAPLLYTNVVIAPDANGPEPQVGVEVAYAYIERQSTTVTLSLKKPNETVDPNNPYGTMADTVTTKVEVPIISHSIGLNFTRYSKEVNLADQIETYWLRVTPDVESARNLTMIPYLGSEILINQTIPSSSYTITLAGEHLGQPLSFDPEQVYDLSKNESGYSVYMNWPLVESRLVFSTGNGTFCLPIFGETIFISIIRVVWGMSAGNSNFSSMTQEVVAEVELEKFGDGFIYNKIIPEDQLLQMDPFKPYEKLCELGN